MATCARRVRTRVRARIRPVVLTLSAFLHASATAQSSFQAPYVATPYATDAMGNFSTGSALVDIDGDGYKDLVLANGNVASPQSLVVYSNTHSATQPFRGRPDWYSEDIAYRGSIAVGDVDGDGDPDVAVAVPFNLASDVGAGGAVLYRNDRGQLSPRPVYRTAGGFMALGCALGDVDGDGDLDLAVAVGAEGPGTFPNIGLPANGLVRVFLNENGRLQTSPAWVSGAAMMAADVAFADVNLDGRMDLVVAAQRAAVFYGSAPTSYGSVPLPSQPSWQSTDKVLSSYGVDLAWIDARTQAVIVTHGCLSDPQCKGSQIVGYVPTRAATVAWRSASSANATKLRVLDVNGDGFADLVVAQEGIEATGAPLLIFPGLAAGWFQTDPAFRSATKTVGEQIAAADTRRAGLTTQTEVFRGPHGHVVTLKERLLDAVVSVRLDGRALASTSYAWSPQSNWVSLAEELTAESKLEVVYRSSRIVDLAVAIATPQSGSYLFYSDLPTKKRF